MAKRQGIDYIIDEKGRKKAVVMSYKAYQQLLEDIGDLCVKAQRKDETPEDFETVLAELKNAGRL